MVTLNYEQVHQAVRDAQTRIRKKNDPLDAHAIWPHTYFDIVLALGLQTLGLYKLVKCHEENGKQVAIRVARISQLVHCGQNVYSHLGPASEGSRGPHWSTMRKKTEPPSLIPVSANTRLGVARPPSSTLIDKLPKGYQQKISFSSTPSPNSPINKRKCSEWLPPFPLINKPKGDAPKKVSFSSTTPPATPTSTQEVDIGKKASSPRTKSTGGNKPDEPYRKNWWDY